MDEKIEALGEFEVVFTYEELTATFPIHVVAE
jgi:hypothetical protein